MKNVATIMPVLFFLLLIGCASYAPDQRVWDLPYQPKTIALDVVDKAGMSAEDRDTFTSTLIRVLGEKNIHVDKQAKTKLTVDVITYQEQSAGVSFLRFIGQTITVYPFRHYSSNSVDLRAHITRSDGSIVEFKKLKEIKESSMTFEYLLESMLRRVSMGVFMTDLDPSG